MMTDPKIQHYQTLYRMTSGDLNTKIRAVLREYADPEVRLSAPSTWFSNRTWGVPVLHALNSTQNLAALCLTLSAIFKAPECRLGIKRTGDFAAALAVLETVKEIEIHKLVDGEDFMQLKKISPVHPMRAPITQWDDPLKQREFDLLVQRFFDCIDRCTMGEYQALRIEAKGFEMFDIVMQIRQGDSLLHKAILQEAKRSSFEDYQVISALIKEGNHLNLELKDQNGNTPLLKALLLERGDLVDVLKNLGASLEAQTRRGVSANAVISSPKNSGFLWRSQESVGNGLRRNHSQEFVR